MTYSIVITNVKQVIAPAPNKLQNTGALISQGGTTTAQDTLSLITQPSDLTPLLTAAAAISTITWASSVATVTTAAPHGFTNPSTLYLNIAGTTPAGYSGVFLCTITGASTFTYPLATNPGAETVPGTYLVQSGIELQRMVTTYFAQGYNQAVYVLELGPGSPAAGVTTLSAYLVANPFTIYAILVPYEWSSESTFLALIATYEGTTSKLYFWVTCSTGNYTSFTALMKDVFLMVEAPAVVSAHQLVTTEFSAAAPFQVALSTTPSSTSMVSPFAFTELVGVTPYPTVGNAALLATLTAANVNYVGTGAEGGVSNAILILGKMKDGNQWNYWYSVDWVQIQGDEDISNAVINGSNSQPPLYYDQNGINHLEAVVQQVMTNGVSFGLVNPNAPVIVTATPFATYVQQHPGDYPQGIYNGLAVTYTPQLGFTQITFNIQVSQFPTS